MKLPTSAKYVIIGAGVHGLSTAYHLALELRKVGKGSGKDIVVLDKKEPGAGATGIACGCVRNFYMTEEIHPLMRHSLDVWMSDPVNFGFQQVSYISCGEKNQIDDYKKIHKNQNRVGYPADLYIGEEAKNFLKKIWPDFKTEHIDVAIHEKLSGYAGTMQLVIGLAKKCAELGVKIMSGVEVEDYEMKEDKVTIISTNKGKLEAETVFLCVGAWVGKHWELLGKSDKIDLHFPDGEIHKDQDMWTFWRLVEGEIYTPDFEYRTADGRDPPVLHVELMNTPVIDPKTGKQLEDHTYVYWKNGAERMDKPGIQGGSIPIKLGPKAILDPYGHENDEYQAEPEFADYLCAAMGQLMGRFTDCRKNFRERRNGGIGAFTPDNRPIIGWILPNVYMIADSNHGFKLTGVGKLVAQEVISNNPIAELEPFRFSRFAEGKTFPVTNSNCPWV